MPVRDILNLPGIRAIFFVSVVTVAAQDLIVVYLPLLGRERDLTVDDVGSLLRFDESDDFTIRRLGDKINERHDARRLPCQNWSEFFGVVLNRRIRPQRVAHLADDL